MPHEVFAVEGDRFPACRRCGSRAYFSLSQAASHIEEDQDFSRSSADGKAKQTNAGLPKIE
jgi:hypothetical protein